MSLSINNVRGVLSSVSFDNEISSKKSPVDTFEMVSGGNFLKSHKNAAKDGKASSSSEKVADATQTQNQAQGAAKEVDAAKDEAQSQAQGAKEAQAQDQGAKAKY